MSWVLMLEAVVALPDENIRMAFLAVLPNFLSLLVPCV